MPSSHSVPGHMTLLLFSFLNCHVNKQVSFCSKEVQKGIWVKRVSCLFMFLTPAMNTPSCVNDWCVERSTPNSLTPTPGHRPPDTDTRQHPSGTVPPNIPALSEGTFGADLQRTVGPGPHPGAGSFSPTSNRYKLLFPSLAKF